MTHTKKIIETIKLIAPVFGAINLEDISAPRCVEIENALKECLDIPVFHDDQHGTAVVVLAGIINALKIVGKKFENIKVVVNGDGSAGYAISKMLYNFNVKNIVVCGIDGIIKEDENNNIVQNELLKFTNPNGEEGKLEDALKGSDVFIGVSKGNIVDYKMIERMNDDAIVFAMANPTPEIMPDEAKRGGAKIVGTGRSDFDNQVNNVLAFPGIFKGALEAGVKQITEEMKVAAAKAIASCVLESDLSEDNILPLALDRNVSDKVAKAVYDIGKSEAECGFNI